MNTTITQFNGMLQSGKINSITTAAKAMNTSASSLSQYLRGQYTGNVEKLESKVISYLQLIKERELTNDDEIQFIEGLKNTQLVIDITRLTHIRKTIGLITGRAGYGKSLALKRYAAKYQDVVYVEADGAYNAKELLKEICLQCGTNGIGHLNKLKKDIIQKLENSGRLIIVDQAEYLPDKALDLLRTIHDKAGVGLLLAGLPILQNNIKGVDGIHEQIYTRIGAAIQLEQPTEEDLRAQIKNYVACDDETKECFIKESRKNPRVLYILIRESKRIAKNKNIAVNPDVVKKASKQLVK